MLAFFYELRVMAQAFPIQRFVFDTPKREWARARQIEIVRSLDISFFQEPFGDAFSFFRGLRSTQERKRVVAASCFEENMREFFLAYQRVEYFRDVSLGRFVGVGVLDQINGPGAGRNAMRAGDETDRGRDGRQRRLREKRDGLRSSEREFME